MAEKLNFWKTDDSQLSFEQKFKLTKFRCLIHKYRSHNI